MSRVIGRNLPLKVSARTTACSTVSASRFFPVLLTVGAIISLFIRNEEFFSGGGSKSKRNQIAAAITVRHK